VQAILPQATWPSIDGLLSQLEALVQHYEQHGSSQAPMLHLLHQMMRLMLSTMPSNEVGADEQNLSFVSIEEPVDLDGSIAPPASRNQSAALISPESRFVPHSDRFLVSVPIQASRLLPSDGTNLPIRPNASLASKHDLHHECGFPPPDGTNALALPASQTATMSASGKTSRLLPPDGTNLPEALSINDSFSQERYNEKKKASSFIDRAASGQEVQVPSTWLEAQSSPMQAQSCTEPRGEENRDGNSAVQIRQEAVRYAYLLDGDTQWLGKLVLCVRQYPAHLRRLACIATLVRLYVSDGRSRPNRPGAWFSHTCKLLAQGVLQLPEEVYQWAATELDEEQIATAIQQGYLPPEPEESGPSAWMGSEPSPTAFDTWAEQPEQWEHVAAPPSTEPMDREMAEQLAAKVSRDVASDPFPSQIELLPGRHPGRWRVLLTWNEGVEVPLDTEEEWVSYFSRVQATATLMEGIGPGRSQHGQPKNRKHFSTSRSYP
jgi:hypothetical protein